jgi:lysozyme
MVSDEMANKIKVFEGLRRQPYLCPGNYWTVGYGHALGTGKPGAIRAQEIRNRGGVSDDEIAAMFAADLRISERAVARLIKRALKQRELDALASFTFNLGSGALERSTLRMRVNRGEPAAAVRREFLRWVHSNGKVLPGLVIRRKVEANHYEGRAGAEETIPAPAPRPKPPQPAFTWKWLWESIVAGLRKPK